MSSSFPSFILAPMLPQAATLSIRTVNGEAKVEIGEAPGAKSPEYKGDPANNASGMGHRLTCVRASHPKRSVWPASAAEDGVCHSPARREIRSSEQGGGSRKQSATEDRERAREIASGFPELESRGSK